VIPEIEHGRGAEPQVEIAGGLAGGSTTMHIANAVQRNHSTGGPDRISENLFFLAASPAMLHLRHEIERVARVDVPVLCVGESGTGKEVVARLLHLRSPRANRTFLKVNCAALPADLLESELFGYEAGAFTGAVRGKPGKFELSDGGTIFLDEVGEMPTALQAKLLHVLQDQTFARLGGRSRIRVDVRVVAATNIEVEQAIAEKRLRADLFYRLSTFIFRLPPLRERPEDIPVLLRHYIGHFARTFGVQPPEVPETMIERALRYSWPGNVRELENFAKRYIILGGDDLLSKETECRRQAPQDLKTLISDTKASYEAEAIRRALNLTRWNRKEAARRLQISYAALLYKIRQYGLDAEAPEENAV
jgi:two-component system response regulator AtoC